jgi:hypothetical protein
MSHNRNHVLEPSDTHRLIFQYERVVVEYGTCEGHSSMPASSDPCNYPTAGQPYSPKNFQLLSDIRTS